MNKLNFCRLYLTPKLSDFKVSLKNKVSLFLTLTEQATACTPGWFAAGLSAQNLSQPELQVWYWLLRQYFKQNHTEFNLNRQMGSTQLYKNLTQ